ncbi:hypothetical protein PF006_g10804 [Phytophthora fragariae]|uniref:DDE Tnp4 domain-containing protein n=1 Tax=Phytophthora fragariae TaxID=53985 RepID=A0A6A3TZG8_9STRA|nr:hypothetical protein PF009_g13686 [Phytophthora fragariae]KAE9144245.1 hypothetical protein PF006_g10804 [Phytophthora fragariae]
MLASWFDLALCFSWIVANGERWRMISTVSERFVRHKYLDFIADSHVGLERQFESITWVVNSRKLARIHVTAHRFPGF